MGDGGHMVRFSWGSALSRFGESISVREPDGFFFWVTLRCAAVQQQFRNILNSRARRVEGVGPGRLR